MKNFVLALLMFVVMLFAVSSANATPRSFRPRSDFDAGFAAGARAVRGGHVRDVGPRVVEIRRGPFGGVRSVRVR